MSYFPCDLPSFYRTTQTFGSFCARMQLSRQSPTSFTTSSFVVPRLNSGVNFLPVLSPSAFLVNDYIVIGSRATLLKAPIHSTTGPGSLVFSGYMPGSLQAGNTVSPAGYRFISVDDPTKRTVCQTSSWTVPNYQQSSDTISITVADRAQIPSGGIVLVSNYAGLYRIVSNISGSSISALLVKRGDLLEGENCIQETSYTYTGAPVSQGYPLTFIEPIPYRHFIPVDACAVALSSSSPGSNTAAISIGYSAGADSGRARMGDYAQGLPVQSGTVLTVGTVKPLFTNVGALDPQRTAVPFGMPLMACVTTNTGTYPTSDTTIDLLVRGFYSEG